MCCTVVVGCWLLSRRENGNDDDEKCLYNNRAAAARRESRLMRRLDYDCQLGPSLSCLNERHGRTFKEERRKIKTSALSIYEKYTARSQKFILILFLCAFFLDNMQHAAADHRLRIVATHTTLASQIADMISGHFSHNVKFSALELSSFDTFLMGRAPQRELDKNWLCSRFTSAQQLDFHFSLFLLDN